MASVTSYRPLYQVPPAPLAEAPRPIDDLDRVTDGGYVDLHADTALQNVDLQDDEPGFFMKLFYAVVDFLAIFIPSLKHFNRHITRRSMDEWPRGLQVMSTVTNGLPPLYRPSSFAYTQLIADWPRHANDSPFNAFMYQIGYIYRQIQQNNERLMMAPDATAAAAAMRGGMIGIQIGMEGAFPLEVGDDDVQAWIDLLSNPNNGFPPGMPIPTLDEVRTYEGRLAYAERIKLAYVGLNHLASSTFAGSSLWPNQNRHGGLTEAGHRLVRDMDRRGIMIDLAHASANAQRDVIRLVDDGVIRGPVIVSHAELPQPGEAPDWRATIEDTVRIVRRTGGVLGIMGARTHLQHSGSRDPRVLMNDICDQIDLLKSLGGIDVISIGLDSDGFVGLPYPTQSETLSVLKVMLKYERGYSDEEIMKIFGGNYMHTLATRDAALRARQSRDLSPIATLAPRRVAR